MSPLSGIHKKYLKIKRCKNIFSDKAKVVKNLQKHDNGESFFFATMLRTFEVCRLFFWLIWGYLLSKFLIKIYHFWLLRVTLFQLISSNNVSQYGVFYIKNVMFLSKIQITVNSVTKCKNEKTFTTNDLYKISCKSKIYLIKFLLHKNLYFKNHKMLK